jgi:hypothetical protein
MMKRSFSSSLLALVFFVSCASAQDSQFKIGIGVSLNPTAMFSSGTIATIYLPVGLTDIYVPIMASTNIRVEPDAGIFTYSSEVSGSSSSKFSGTYFRLGIGLFYVRPVEASFDFYVGPRLGILASSSSTRYGNSAESTLSETDFFIGACVGGEYLFSRHFSMGGEAQLNYISYGKPDYSSSPNTSSRNQTALTNNALIFFRWYF